MVLGLLRRLEGERKVEHLTTIGWWKRCMVRASIFQFLHLLAGLVVYRSLSHQYIVIRDFCQDHKYTSWVVISRVNKRYLSLTCYTQYALGESPECEPSYV